MSVGKIREYDEERVLFFEEKRFSSFKNAFLPNCEGAKYAGGSRPFCLYCFQRSFYIKRNRETGALLFFTLYTLTSFDKGHNTQPRTMAVKTRAVAGYTCGILSKKLGKLLHFKAPQVIVCNSFIISAVFRKNEPVVGITPFGALLLFEVFLFF